MADFLQSSSRPDPMVLIWISTVGKISRPNPTEIQFSGDGFLPPATGSTAASRTTQRGSPRCQEGTAWTLRPIKNKSSHKLTSSEKQGRMRLPRSGAQQSKAPGPPWLDVNLTGDYTRDVWSHQTFLCDSLFINPKKKTQLVASLGPLRRRDGDGCAARRLGRRWR